MQDKNATKNELAESTQMFERDMNLNIHVNFGPRSELEREYDADPANFSTYHPQEAYRIRMKRTAMEEAALSAAYHKIKGAFPSL